MWPLFVHERLNATVQILHAEMEDNAEKAGIALFVTVWGQGTLGTHVIEVSFFTKYNSKKTNKLHLWVWLNSIYSNMW